MAMMKVYGHPFSSASKRVYLCLAEKELEYETVTIDLTTGQQKKEPMISINPFGQVPGFQDGDLTLFESRAINKYIAHTFADKGTPLLSEDRKKMGIILVWLEVEAMKFDAVASVLFYELCVKPFKGIPTDEANVEKQQAQLASVLDIYEARLAQSKYLAGDSYTLADLHHIPIMDGLLKTKVKPLFEERPHVQAWCDEILARPAPKKVLGN